MNIMSCHTWTYSAVSSLTKRDKDKIIKNGIEHINSSFIMNATLEQWIASFNTSSEAHKKMYSVMKTEIYYKNTRKNYNDSLGKMKAGDFNEALKYQSTTNYDGIDYINCIDDNGDAIVRVSGYPHEYFTSPSELIDFLYKHNQAMVGYYDEDDKFHRGMSKEIEDRINNFFRNVKGGLISFG